MVERAEEKFAKVGEDIERAGKRFEKMVSVLTRLAEKFTNKGEDITRHGEILDKGADGITETEKTATYWEDRSKRKKAALTYIEAAFYIKNLYEFST